ncbi:ribosomal L7Ae/L30e/S12e/Gadd45 family protein [Clostridiisalibacter paucivorans]|uniref:ribosomal L7Ae/L30e/S12e/Gadd45 family protein n=1 Tax=Clostridiisalibacter paucivorans TaxID=408753 RepID=UPI00047A9097|nr:ribosomal L7Ae/L30e/S12e/Gadd45 family protein [Clostridiisalibacter paucivorans]
MLSDLKDKKKVIGTKQAKRAVINDKVEMMYIAKDADRFIIDSLVQLCNEKTVDVVFVEHMKELGKACGIDVSAASVALLK